MMSLGKKYKIPLLFNIQDFVTVTSSVERVREEVFPGPTLV